MSWYNREIIKLISFDFILVFCIYFIMFILYSVYLNHDFGFLYTILSIVFGSILAALIFRKIDKKWRTEYG
jgi:tetrahydromethanopterin S-methyltransferase subunit E